MKRILFILLLCFPVLAMAQTPGTPTAISSTNYFSFLKYMGADSGLVLAVRDTNFHPSAPVLVYRPADGQLYYWNTGAWASTGGAAGVGTNLLSSVNANTVSLASSTGTGTTFYIDTSITILTHTQLGRDTANLSAQQLLRVKYADSLGGVYLTPTQFGKDTVWISNRINLKVDSVKRVLDSVFYYANGTKHFAFLDSLGAGATYTATAPITLTGAAFGIDTARHVGGVGTNWFIDSLINLYLPASDSLTLIETRNHARLTFQLLGNYRPYSAIPPWDSTLQAGDTAYRNIVQVGTLAAPDTMKFYNTNQPTRVSYITQETGGNLFIYSGGGNIVLGSAINGALFSNSIFPSTANTLNSGKYNLYWDTTYSDWFVASKNILPAGTDTIGSWNTYWTGEFNNATLTGTLTLPSQTANYGFMAPNGSSGVPSFRALVNADLPLTLQQVTGNGIDSTNNISAFTMGLKVGFYGTSFGGITTGGLQVIAPSGTVWAGLFQGNNATNLPVMLLGSESGVGIFQSYTYNAGATVNTSINPFGGNVLIGTNTNVPGSTLIVAGNSLIEGNLKTQAPLVGSLTDSPAVYHASDSTWRLIAPGVSDSLTYAQHIYAAYGSSVKAEPIAGNAGNITGETTLTSQQIQYVTVYLPKASTITGVKWFQWTAGSYTASNYNGVALYSYSAGTLTLIDTSTASSNIWTASSFGWATQALKGTHYLQAGTYVIAMLYSESAQTTAPVIGAYSSAVSGNIMSLDFSNSAKLNALLATQTTMAATKAMSALSTTNVQFYVALY